jgi:hypothetical protein
MPRPSNSDEENGNLNPIDVNSEPIVVPKPASILAEEKRLGIEMKPVYRTMSFGRGDTREVGTPTHYEFDNGNNQIVTYAPDGTYVNTVQKSKGNGLEDLLKFAATAAGAYFLGPLAFEALGIGSAATAPLAFTPEMIAAGAFTPGSIGAAGAAANVLTAEQLAAMYGVNSGITTLAPTLSQLPSGPPSTPGTPPPPNLDLPPPSGIETLPSGPPSTPGTPPPPDLGPPVLPPTPPAPPIPSGPPSTPGTPPPPDVGPPGSNLQPPIPSGPPSTPGTPPPPDVGPPGSNIPPVIPPGTSGIKDLVDKAKDVLGSGSGSGSGMGVLGLMALMAMMNKGGGGTPASTVTIPELTATRSQLPYDVDKKGVNPNTPYRPGQGGVNYFSPTTYTPTPVKAAGGGLMSLGQSNLGGYSDGGRLLQGPGDGVSDSIPAIIGRKQPARLANGEFVIPARIVSELGNGSTDAGAKRLYEMMARVQKARRNTKNVAANTKAAKYLPA